MLIHIWSNHLKYYKLSKKGSDYQVQLKNEWLDFVKKVAVLI